MLKKCSNCNSKVSTLEFYKQYYRNRYIYKCSKCGTVYGAIAFSRILNFIILVALYFYLIKRFSLLTNIIFLLIYISIVEPLLSIYKKKN